MEKHVCPWWLAYTFDNPLRRALHNPAKLLGDYINKGDIVADIGCGMGFFSLVMAEMVGEEGKVVAVDIQSKMLQIVQKRAERKGVEGQIQVQLSGENSIGISRPVDFVLAFWMLHEVPDPENFLKEIYTLLKPSGYFFYAEPKLHVPRAKFEHIAKITRSAGMKPIARPEVAFSRAIVFTT
jgi:ubiquinone/menaquinone biosynthesis C-methylase UbiE